ncbi:DNA-binding protein WhiA [Mycoplasma leonicaptivi]|uniref:DNA-binding protein WhiA n=1 Tax=Mycoplasma leonicaptivi TaxID=36742 RepID=UPI000488B021|nr:DNA-binding protein WhiA [Mycoplasma leonicaptivi]
MKTKNSVSFSAEIKKEILLNIKNKQEILYFFYGLIYANGIFDKDFIEINIKNDYILNKIISKLEKIKVFLKKKNNTKNKYLVHSNSFKEIKEINFGEYLSHFFGGIFVGSGSISDKNSTSYHLEICTHYDEFAQKIINKLNEYNFNFQIFKKTNKYKMYIKKIDEILDFLSAIGTKKAWFELQNLKIKRDFENVSNRINNIDFSNLQKIANSSIKHIDNINYIFENNLESIFNEDQLMFFRIKLENPWISLNNLVDIFQKENNINISKSGINHWLRKLNLIVVKHKNML